jgi:hypothetical protein
MAKHFKCPECPRKLENVASMSSHMTGVHKQKLTKYASSNLSFTLQGVSSN